VGRISRGATGILNALSKRLFRDCGGWSDFRTLLDWLSWALGLTGEEPQLSDQVNEKLYRQVDLGPLLEHPYDYLGDLVAQGKANGWNPTAFILRRTPSLNLWCGCRCTILPPMAAIHEL
jgi:hypothetical protein